MVAAQADDLLSSEENVALREQAQAWIKCSADQWLPVFEALNDEQLLSLAGFYIKAEMSLAGFESGADNPAIAVFRYLKDQGRLPGKDVIRALKAQTSNRYIPYGKVML